MSYFIATFIQYDENKDRINLIGGDNNVIPRSNSWTHYNNKKYLLQDLISGSIDISRCRSKFADTIKAELESLKRKHKKQFGQRQEELSEKYSGKSINAYSLYRISKYSNLDKETILNNKRDLSVISKDYHEEVLAEADAMELVWDEAVEFYIEAEHEFYNAINVPIGETQLDIFTN